MIPSPRDLSCVSGAFLGGSQGGAGMPPLVTCNVRQRAVAQGSAPKFVFGQFLLFLADFAIFSRFVN
jgi:hypothetical protein